MVKFIKNNWKGIALCLGTAVPAWFMGKVYPVIGGAVTAIILGIIIGAFIKNKRPFESGVRFVSKKILQAAVVFLGFGMDLNVIVETGKRSLPIIIATVSAALIVAFLLHKAMRIPSKISVLVGVGSSICGGSAIAAAAPVIDADDDEIAQAVSVIFFFNVIAALIFPALGRLLGFSSVSGEAFGIFAGTAINDTSSVTSAASTWDSMWGLGTQTLDTAVTVKLTRTLAIIPITLALAFYRAARNKGGEKVSIGGVFPLFILFFLLASVITTAAVSFGADVSVFAPMKTLSKFLIVTAMAAIGINTDIVKLIKTGGKPLVMGFFCWISITAVSLAMQYALNIW